jgi:hypothetical protein
MAAKMRWTGFHGPNTVAAMNQTGQQTTYVTCRCQNCNGGIEFDASFFRKGETRAAECPHCKMETLLFVPQPTAVAENKSKPFPATVSPKKAVVLWAITVFLLFVVLPFCGNSNLSPIVGLLAFGFLIAAAIATGRYKTLKDRLNPPKPNYICTNCGTLLTWRLKYRPTEKDICSQCGTNFVVPLGTPRGQELLATYHGKVTAKERVEIGDEATRKLLRSLEPIPASGSIAIELEKLAALVRTGAITTDEWQRAKNLYLGQPEGKKREHALARIRELHDLQQAGAVSESEFNAVKWDILSRGVV